MELCYLLAFPDVTEGQPPPSEPFRGLKDAPYFQPVDIQLHTIGEEMVEIHGRQVSVLRQYFDGRAQVVEFRYDVGDPFLSTALSTRQQMELALQNRFVPEPYRKSGLFEEYTILLVGKARPSPDQWIASHQAALARFIRSQREMLDPAEIGEILGSRVRYSKNDLTLVDWEAAVIIASDGDFQSDITLLKIGNYQLLRYRMLGQSVESMLGQINAEFLENRKRPLRPGPTRATIRRVIQHRLEVMLDFEHTEQNLLLIGDWYTAKVYEAIRDEFYLEEWKSAVRDKLGNLESIIETIQANFSLTWSGLMERVELAGWLILLIGYIILYFFDARLIK